MRYLMLLLLLSALLTATAQSKMEAPEGVPKINRTVLYMSPFQLFASQFQVGLEVDFAQKHSLLVQGSVILDNNAFNGEPDAGSMAELYYRFKYVQKINPERRKEGRKYRFELYAGPMVQYQYLLDKEEWSYFDNLGQEHFVNQKTRYNSIAGGMIFGSRMIFMDHLTLDFYMGGAVKYTFNGDQLPDPQFLGGVFQPSFTGIIPKGNLQLGIAF